MARDKILIRDLLVRGIIGLEDWERKSRQDIVINLTVEADLAKAGASDDMADSLNYRTLAKALITYTESSSHHLVEALAEALARIAVVEHGAERVWVRVEKPGALRFARSVGVEIERERADFPA
ncbi:MAG TPA: dihydroneopterin aldolase [Thermoanaerobaculia bacterium]|nr:dihydroneopterin aldolase [Thermoanaerobaculia bacterium]